MTVKNLGVAGVLVASLAAGGGVEAQDVDHAGTETVPETRATTGGWGAVTIVPRVSTTVVSITIAFPSGSADDLPGASGTAWLFGQVVRGIALSGLDPASRSGTELTVEVGRSRTIFRLTALPVNWEEAYGVLEWALLRADPSPAATNLAQVSQETVFAFEERAPVRELEAELYRTLASGREAWSRRPEGDPASVASLTPEQLAAHRARAYPKGSGVVALVGPVEPDAAARVLTGGPPLPGGTLTLPDYVPLASRAARDTLWSVGERIRTVRDVTNSWVLVAYPVDPSTPATTIEMLEYMLDGRFNTDPPDPGIFTVDSSVEHVGPSRILLVEAVVIPESAAGWEERIVREIERIAAEPMEPAFFHTFLRGFRTARLIEESAPEVEGNRLASDLLVDGVVRSLPDRILTIDPEALSEAARTLRAPRILVFGPDLSGASGG